MAKGKLRSMFTDQEVVDAICSGDAQDYLYKLRGVEVSKQLLNYWSKKFEAENAKKNGDPYVGETVLNRKLRNEMQPRTPDKTDYDAIAEQSNDSSVVMIIPDQHAPYHHRDTIPFLAAVKAKLNPTRIINLGDETDGHALSFHDADPSLDSAGVELSKARIFIKQLSQLFPQMEVCHSNHGSLIYRRAFKHGLPAEYIKSYRDILFPDGGGDGWSWSDEIRFTLPNKEAVVFRHHFVGNRNQVGHGIRAHVVQGHLHGTAEISYNRTTAARNWAMVCGCLIDPDALAFAYGKMYEGKALLGCSAIVDSQPVIIPMDLDQYGRWTGVLGGIFK
jgi:hypothetical protein